MALSAIAKTVSAKRIVRLLLVLIGGSLIVYAISDHPFYGGEPGFGRVQVVVTGIGVGIALCALLPERVASGILLLTVTSFAMVAFAEIVGARALASRHRPIYQFDDRVIFKLIPGSRSTMTRLPVNGGDTVTHQINRAGFRGPELVPRGDMMRVVLYGDSFINAFYSQDKETFAHQLEERLSARSGNRVELVNAGVSSYGPDQILLKMQDELPQLRPDLVVVAVFAGNDYGDLLRNKMFRLSEDGALVANRWRLDPKVREMFDLSQKESILVRAVRNTLRSIRTGPEGRHMEASNMDFLLAEAEREYQSFVVARDDVVTNTHVDYYSADVSLTPGAASARYKVAMMRAILQRIRDLAERSAVPLVFLFIPHPVDVMEQYDWGAIDRKRFPDYHRRNQTAFLEDMARALDVPYLSLYDIFRAKNAIPLYFLGGDDHWNAAGQRIAAEAMADYLRARGLPRAVTRN